MKDFWVVLVLVTACASESAPPSGGSEPDTSAEAVTWHGEVAPILDTRCGGCHVEGGAGPFPLQTYEQAAPLAEAALAAVEDGRMPPWLPDRSCRTFRDERLVTAVEVQTLRDWIAAGKPEGAPAPEVEAPATAPFEPTHTARIRSPYTPSAATPDDYRCFILDIDVEEERYLRASQVVPDQGALVHHVIVYALEPSMVPTIEAADAAEEQEGYTCFGGPYPSTSESGAGAGPLPGGSLPNQLAAWVPGAAPAIADPGEGIRIAAGSRLVMQIHYNLLSSEPKPDATEIQLVLDSEPPERLTRSVPLPILDLSIEAGDPESVQTRTFTNYRSEPITIAALMGHMHLLGSSMRATVRRKGGGEECLIDIPEWDYSWQQSYLLETDQRVTLEPGDAITLTCVYDNSAANQPVVNGEQLEPREVTWGEGTLDEMCLLYVTTVGDFEPAPETGATDCHGAGPCVAACEGEPSLDCLLSCETTTIGCAVCGVQGLPGCGQSCVADLAAMQPCLKACGTQVATIGGSFSACFAAECPELYASVLSCIDPVIQSGACDQPLTDCGITFPAP